MKHRLFIALAILAALSACSKTEQTAAVNAPEATKESAAALSTEVAPTSGKVTQIQNSAGYTYAEVETGAGKRIWIAGGLLEAKVGDTVQWGGYSLMHNFNAKSLGQTFDEILFVESWELAGGAKAAAVAPHGDGQSASPPVAGGHPPMAGAAPASAGGSNVGKVKSVSSAGGYTYLEVQQNDNTVWLAVPETEVTTGKDVSWGGGSLMQNFTSKSLNRTFESIIFAEGVKVVN